VKREEAGRPAQGPGWVYLRGWCTSGYVRGVPPGMYGGVLPGMYGVYLRVCAGVPPGMCGVYLWAHTQGGRYYPFTVGLEEGLFPLPVSLLG